MLEARLRKEVKKLGGKAVKFTSVSEAGLPDRIVLMPGGKTYFVELKSGIRGVTSPLQSLQIRQLRYLGFYAKVISTREELDTFLTVIEYHVNNQTP